MAQVGRYSYCPAAGKIRRSIPTISDLLRRRKARKRRVSELFLVGDYQPAYYPTGYKK